MEQALYLHMIKSSAEFLLNSITDLIDKWEIQTDTFSALANQPDYFSLRDCVEDSIDTVSRPPPPPPATVPFAMVPRAYYGYPAAGVALLPPLPFRRGFLRRPGLQLDHPW